jgi:hypothetical protein
MSRTIEIVGQDNADELCALLRARVSALREPLAPVDTADENEARVQRQPTTVHVGNARVHIIPLARERYADETISEPRAVIVCDGEGADDIGDAIDAALLSEAEIGATEAVLEDNVRIVLSGKPIADVGSEPRLERWKRLEKANVPDPEREKERLEREERERKERENAAQKDAEDAEHALPAEDIEAVRLANERQQRQMAKMARLAAEHAAAVDPDEEIRAAARRQRLMEKIALLEQSRAEASEADDEARIADERRQRQREKLELLARARAEAEDAEAERARQAELMRERIRQEHETRARMDVERARLEEERAARALMMVARRAIATDVIAAAPGVAMDDPSTTDQ